MSKNREIKDATKYNIKPSHYMAEKRLEDNSSEKTKLLKMKLVDWIVLALIMITSCLITFINLGTTKVPKTYWENTYSGEYIIIKCDDYKSIEKAWIYSGIPNGRSSFSLSFFSSDNLSEDSQWTIMGNREVEQGEMYRWQEIQFLNNLPTGKYIAVRAGTDSVRLNELVFTDAYNNKIDVEFADEFTEYGEKILDEQKFFPQFSVEKTAHSSAVNASNGTNSYFKTDMYFDEIYHARTAFEHINGWGVYETTHPPLGKILIGLGIRMFGMTPFGWRIISAVFSVMSVFVMYLLGKLLFKKPLWAGLAAGLFMLDGLRFVQGRIATLDSIVCFFILTSYFFMFMFMRANFNKESILKTLIPFAFSGLFFGFSVATKWTGVYAGVGLLALVVLTYAKRYTEYIVSKNCLKDNINVCFNAENIKSKFKINTLFLIATGVLCFIIIPFIIYLLSYLPYPKVEGQSLFNVMWLNQKHMLSYHGNLKQPHASASDWWTWPLAIKSVYFYLGDTSYGANIAARIHTLVNPMITYIGLFALLYFAYYFIKKYKARNERIYDNKDYIENRELMIFVIVAIMANYLPWALIQRATFIYHFLPTMPFLICVIVMFFKNITSIATKEIFTIGKNQMSISKGAVIVTVLVFLCVLNFTLFFPIYSGMPISKNVAWLFGYKFWGF